MNTREAKRVMSCLSAALWLWICPLAAAQATFDGLGIVSARAISADGSAVVGHSHSRAEAFRWTKGDGFEHLGHASVGDNWSAAVGVNADGSVVVGQSGYCDFFGLCFLHAARWTETGGERLITNISWANDVSADGSVVVGSVWYPSGHSRAFRWTSAQGVEDLGTLAPVVWSEATGVSADGAVVVGASGGVFRWTENGGMTSLGLPAGASSVGRPAVSSDGSIVVGAYGTGGSGAGLFRWTSATGMVALTDPETIALTVLAASDDASVIVGKRLVSSPNSYQAFVWHESLGLVDLNDYLPTVGIDLTGWHLFEATGISADGLTIVGHGYHNGFWEAWIAVIPEPAALSLLAMGSAAFLRRRC